MVNPDPEKDDLEYGADTYKTLVGIYPVTEYCCVQTNQRRKGRTKSWRPTPNSAKIGTKVKLIITPEVTPAGGSIHGRDRRLVGGRGLFHFPSDQP